MDSTISSFITVSSIQILIWIQLCFQETIIIIIIYHNFAVPTDSRVKIKDNEKMDKYLDLVRQSHQKMWIMMVTVIPLVVGALGTIPKGLEKRLEEFEIRKRIETSRPYHW